MAKIYLYSSLTNAIDFVVYEANNGPNQVPKNVITVPGGANIVLPIGGLKDASRGVDLKTAVKKEIDSETRDFLEKQPLFQQLERNQFVKILEINEDPEKVAGELSDQDKSAQKTEKQMNEDLKGKKGKPSDVG